MHNFPVDAFHWMSRASSFFASAWRDGRMNHWHVLGNSHRNDYNEISERICPLHRERFCFRSIFACKPYPPPHHENASIKIKSLLSIWRLLSFEFSASFSRMAYIYSRNAYELLRAKLIQNGNMWLSFAFRWIKYQSVHTLSVQVGRDDLYTRRPIIHLNCCLWTPIESLDDRIVNYSKRFISQTIENV